MRSKGLSLSFCFFTLPLLIACASASPAEQISQPADTPAATSGTEAEEPTQEGFQIPQGRLLIYSSPGDEGGRYDVINLPDLTVEPFEPMHSDEWFVDWSYVLSPGARYLAYRRSVNQDYANHSLYVLDIESGEATRITDYSQSNGIPTWTADERFMEFDKLDQGLFIYDTQTGSLSEVQVDSEFADASAISPSGDQIAYAGGCPGLIVSCPVDLYIVNDDGTGEQLLETGDIDLIFWSRDGRGIYYSLFGDRETYGNSGETEDAGYRLHYFDLESGQSRLIEDWRFNTEASSSSFLSPDGEFLAYVFGNAGLKVVKTPDFSLVDFVPGFYVAWSPDSRSLATGTWEGQWYLFDVRSGESITLDVDLQGAQIVGWLP